MDAEVRWIRAFHLLFFTCLGIPVIGTLTGSGGDPAERAVTLGLATLMAAWHWFFVVRRPHLLERLNPMAWHLLVLISLLAVLISRDALYEVTLFGMFALPYLLLPGWWAYLGSTLLVMSAKAAEGAVQRIAEDPSELGGLLGGTALVLLMGVFANFLVKESERNRTIGVLEERARLAREIHDTLAQGFSGIIAQLEAAEQTIDDTPAVQKRISIAKGLARDSLNEARRSVDALRPGQLERADLDRAVRTVAEQWSATAGVPVTVTVDGRSRPLGAETETALLRAAQEGLANVSRHATARQVALTLSYMDDGVTLDLLDDGAGFDPAAVRGGFGLTAMRQRAAQAGGTLTVESAAGEGTALCVNLPYA